MKTILTLLAALFVTVSVRAGDVADISIADLKKAIETKQATIIDVNGKASYEKGRVPTAKDWTAIKENLAANLPADKGALVVAYCGNEHCGAYMAAAKAAKELGYTNVKHLSVGIAGWKQAGEPLER